MSTLRYLYINRLEAAFLLNGPPVSVGAVMSCSVGLNTVTRSSGSFTADGVRRWAVGTGGIMGNGTTTGFPAGSRVTTVGGSTLTMSAVSVGSLSGQSGTFTPDQALTQDVNFPMSNLQGGAGQRYAVWNSGPAPPAAVNVDFDLSGAQSIKVYCALGHLAAAAGNGIGTIDVYSASAYPTFTLRGSITPASADFRDAFFIPASATSARFWRFAVNSTGQFSLGSLWAGAIDKDLGIALAPGCEVTRIVPVSQIETTEGRTITTRLGLPRFRFRFKYGALSDAQRTMIETVFTNTGVNGVYRNPVLLSEDDSIYEGDFVNGELGYSRVFVGVQSMDYGFESMP